MDDISLLDSQRDDCIHKLDALNKSIRKNEEALESLRAFKQVVENSQSDFNSANTAKYGKAEELNEIQKNCLSAEQYFVGTNKTLNGFGGKIIGVAFEGLGLVITLKCASYNAKILALETQANAVNSTINTIDVAKKAAQEAKNALEI